MQHNDDKYRHAPTHFGKDEVDNFSIGELPDAPANFGKDEEDNLGIGELPDAPAHFGKDEEDNLGIGEHLQAKVGYDSATGIQIF